MFWSLGAKWAVALAPPCGLAITGIAVGGTISVSGLVGDIGLDQAKVGFGLLVVQLARQLVLAVASMAAREPVRSHLSGDDVFGLAE